ncbi:hypothetical protein C1H46_010102 [Malus baccata]|uniref:Uncharacterized protein n=1 Tax=Malus baccata TaxID=106549 RepID=A0A540MZT3_MALBA|nr:hypothetical protein C1H46_010102 [Malus baccata]
MELRLVIQTRTRTIPGPAQTERTTWTGKLARGGNRLEIQNPVGTVPVIRLEVSVRFQLDLTEAVD